MTLLRARKPLLLAKVWEADGSIIPAAEAAWFEAGAASVATVRDIFAVLRAVQARPRVALVKETIAPNADAKRLRRRCVAGTDERTGEEYPAGLHPTPQNWLPVDIEKLLRPQWLDWRDGDTLAAHVRDLLPDAFRGAACAWQFSGSAGHTAKRDEIRLHLFFCLNQAVLPAAWKDAFAHLPFVDRGLFDNAKLIFTAGPQPGTAVLAMFARAWEVLS